MRNNIWRTFVLLLVPLFLGLSIVNIVGAANDAMSYNDSAITSNVMDKIQNDSQLKGSSINVETIGGEVTLKGMVNSQADITRASQLAGWVDGVKKVDNRLSTFSSHHYGAMHPKTDCQVGANWC